MLTLNLISETENNWANTALSLNIVLSYHVQKPYTKIRLHTRRSRKKINHTPNQSNQRHSRKTIYFIWIHMRPVLVFFLLFSLTWCSIVCINDNVWLKSVWTIKWINIHFISYKNLLTFLSVSHLWMSEFFHTIFIAHRWSVWNGTLLTKSNWRQRMNIFKRKFR